MKPNNVSSEDREMILKALDYHYELKQVILSDGISWKQL